ncbi:MAG TPA: NAD(P)/FAD-dependent oxidoreductase, partial [Chitinophagaceae bacterium]|nr:NAD(P)/FAD-dependent oxidoreductase [Chitinophagaceae bacterium]
LVIKTKVCIVGAGPAGTVASLFLSKYGVEHVLTERSVFPREKVCGEFYDGRLRRVFDKLDPALLDEMREAGVIQDINRYSFYNTRMNELHVPSKPNARISTNRPKFDMFLLQKALQSPFVRHFDNANIRSAAVAKEGVVLKDMPGKLNIQAQLALIATGNNSSLPQQVVPDNTSGGHFMLAARGYYRNLNFEQSIKSTHNFMVKDPVRCYIFIAELPGNLATVELFVLRDIAVKHKVSPKALLLHLIEKHPALKKIFAGAGLEGNIRGISIPYTSSRQRISAERVMLCGSCGYNINPLTGLGVGHAVFTAMHAAAQCVKSLDTHDFSAKALQAYDQLIYKSLKFDNRLGKMADFGVKNLHTAVNTLFNIVAASPFLKKSVGKIINKL